MATLNEIRRPFFRVLERHIQVANEVQHKFASEILKSLSDAEYSIRYMQGVYKIITLGVLSQEILDALDKPTGRNMQEMAQYFQHSINRLYPDFSSPYLCASYHEKLEAIKELFELTDEQYKLEQYQ